MKCSGCPSRLVLIEEPLDDIRTDEKKNTLHARELFLELQNEVRYPHYSHIPLQALTGYLTGRSTSFDVFIRKSDILLQFDEYFDSFSYFADRSARKEYWYGRLDALRKSSAAGSSVKMTGCSSWPVSNLTSPDQDLTSGYSPGSYMMKS